MNINGISKLGSIIHCMLHIIILFTICNGFKLNYHTDILNEDNEPIVKTSTGSVLGQYVKALNNEIASFQGIPFAKPPIDDKRFFKPEEIDPWEGVLRAVDKPPACMQHPKWLPARFQTSEDCLYLNIWTPANFKTLKKLPVLVWIHGGGFLAGASSMGIYDGSVLSTLGNVVVASMNYRVGVYGFLNAGINEASGNMGLQDQLLAIKWIKKNICNFGGDSNKITIFGESAGSISTSLHLISPLSQGLFHGAILQSGTAFMPVSVESADSAKSRADSFAELVGCSNGASNLGNDPTNVIKCLKQKSSSDLTSVEVTLTSKFPVNFQPSYGTDCDGCNEFLPESPFKLLDGSKTVRVPVLIGNVNDEATSVFLHFIFPELFPMNKEPNISLLLVKEKLIPTLFKGISGLSFEKLYMFYFGDLKDTDNEDIIKALSDSMSDFTFNCPSLYVSERTDEAYLFWMTHRSKKDPNSKWVGVTHAADLQYVFGKPMINIQKYTDEDRKFSNDLIKKWKTFAQDLYPLNATDKPIWSKFSAANPQAYELNPNREEMIPFPRKEACEFWRPIFFKE